MKGRWLEIQEVIFVSIDNSFNLDVTYTYSSFAEVVVCFLLLTKKIRAIFDFMNFILEFLQGIR